MPRPSRTSRFSKGMRAMWARMSAVSVASVGSSGPDHPIRARYPSALNKFDLRAGRIFDEREVHHAGGELQIGAALQHLDALEIRQRAVEIRHAPADVIER